MNDVLRFLLSESPETPPLDSVEEHRNRRRELERLAVEYPELLFDADGEGSTEVLLDHRVRTPCTGPPAASHA